MILYFIITNSFMFVFLKFFQAIFSYFKKKINSLRKSACFHQAENLISSMYVETKFCNSSEKHRYVIVSSWTDLCICELEVLSTKEQSALSMKIFQKINKNYIFSIIK